MGQQGESSPEVLTHSPGRPRQQAGDKGTLRHCLVAEVHRRLDLELEMQSGGLWGRVSL